MSELLSRITIDPEICHGKPAIRRLRYPVESLLEYLVAGDSLEDILAEFPDLERDDLRACIEFAAQSLKLRSKHLVQEHIDRRFGKRDFAGVKGEGERNRLVGFEGHSLHPLDRSLNGRQLQRGGASAPSW